MLSLMLAAYTLIPHEQAQSPQDKAAFTELSAKFDRLQEETRAYHATEARIDAAYLAPLAKAVLARDATFRRTPTREGEIVLKAPTGMEVAIERREGRWRLVVFRDPLSEQLARGWVYATALTPLAAGPEPAGP